MGGCISRAGARRWARMDDEPVDAPRQDVDHSASLSSEPRRRYRVIMTGLDGAGKATIAGRLIHGKLVETLPTISFELGVMNFNDNTWIELWDIGKYGEVAAKAYIPHSEGLIFVVDSTDRERLPEATEKLHGLLKKASRPVVLVLANKQDSPGALTPPSLADQMRLYSIRRAWHIKGTSAIEERGGVYEAIEWLRNAKQDAQHPIQQDMRRRQRGFCESRRGLP